MLQITIVLDSEGYLNITGPVDDKITMLGLLELSKQIIIQSETAIPAVKVDADVHSIRTKVRES